MPHKYTSGTLIVYVRTSEQHEPFVIQKSGLYMSPSQVQQTSLSYFLGVIFLITSTLCQGKHQGQFASFFTESNCTGQNMTFFETTTEDLRNISANSALFYGLWQFSYMDTKRLLERSGWIYGEDPGACNYGTPWEDDLHDPTTSVYEYESITRLFSGDTSTNSSFGIALYSDQDFKNLVVYTENDQAEIIPRVNMSVTIKSYVFSGETKWTLFEHPGFSGWSQCFAPRSNWLTLNPLTKYQVGSIKRGCTSTEGQTFGYDHQEFQDPVYIDNKAYKMTFLAIFTGLGFVMTLTVALGIWCWYKSSLFENVRTLSMQAEGIAGHADPYLQVPYKPISNSRDSKTLLFNT